MATHFDLEEQEQLDQLKAFWAQWGNLIIWVLILLMGASAAWNGYHWYQRQQASQAASLYDEAERVVQSGDLTKTKQVLGDIQSKFPGTVYAQQATLLGARLQFERGQPGEALSSLQWVIDRGTEKEYQALARLRASALLIEQQKYDDALKMLDGVADLPSFAPLADDRRGDILLKQGKAAEATAAYQAAWKGMDVKLDYRHLVEAKLVALGVSPSASEAKTAP